MEFCLQPLSFMKFLQNNDHQADNKVLFLLSYYYDYYYYSNQRK